MKNKTKGVIAGVAGVALLTGGSTFALWSASADLEGATITNGALAVDAGDPMEWVDVSADRADSPHVIDADEWRMVPGDVAQGTQELTVTMTGDNLVANLSVDTTDVDPPEGVTISYRLLDGTTPLGTGTLDDPLELRFATNASSQGSPADSIILPTGGSKTFVVELTVTFDEDAEESQGESVDLDAIAIRLQQDRSCSGYQP